MLYIFYINYSNEFSFAYILYFIILLFERYLNRLKKQYFKLERTRK